MSGAALTRPALRYHGGKWRLAPWIIANMPAHDVYVEPYGGGANVLLRKDPIPAEVYNDLDGSIVNVFRVLQDETKAARLLRRLYLTPYARAEFDRCYEPAEDDVDQACKTITLSFMGYGSDSATRGCRTGFRSKLSDGRAFPSQSWAGWPDSVPALIERLRGVIIEQKDALELMSSLDAENVLFFVDPPYVTATRSSLVGRSGATHGYRHEMTDDDHRALAEYLHQAQGMVMLSGYAGTLYADLYADWHCIDTKALADGARERVECVWMNPAACSREQQQTMRFA